MESIHTIKLFYDSILEIIAICYQTLIFRYTTVLILNQTHTKLLWIVTQQF